MSNLQISTTQSVNLFFTTASVGSRILAYVVDALIMTAYAVVFFYVLDKLGVMDQFDDPFERYAAVTIVLLPVIFYSLLLETLMGGQTFGKKLLKIKVVKIDGYQAGFIDYAIRWLFQVIDIQILAVPGLISMLVSKHTQRLGDLAAGTAVITEKSKYTISHTILMDVEEDYKPYFAHNQMMVFSDNDIRIIKENSEVAQKKSDTQLLLQLTRKVEEVMKIKNPFRTQSEFLTTLLKDYNYYTGK
jgi:uncharacterized RDD family membrane protein YckC